MDPKEKDKDPWLPLARFLEGQKTPAPPGLRTSLVTERLLQRDLSWLAFNERVLAEAEDPSVPPLERLRFAAIVSSNLDEFFMVRVAETAREARRAQGPGPADGMPARQALSQIREGVIAQKARQGRVFRGIVQALSAQGVRILKDFRQDRTLDERIREKLSEAKVLLRRSGEPLPPLLAGRIYVFVRFPREYAVLDLGDRLHRLVELSEPDGTRLFVLADRWAGARAAEFFPGRDVIEAFPFKIIRDAYLGYRPEEEESLEQQIRAAAGKRRDEARPVRLEVDSAAYSEGAFFLATQLGLDSSALYRFDLPLDVPALNRVYEVPGYDELRYRPIRPQTPLPLQSADLFSVVRRHDVLLHHPYDAFDIVVRFLTQAADDPDVVEIQHTLYRTSQVSPIMEALKDAVRNGKKVAAYIEIKARFDEAANVRWAEELRAAGVRVVRPMGGFKVHSKVTRVVRREGEALRAYVHLGTGNYHPGTARQYTDLGLLTADGRVGEEAGAYFAALTQRQSPAGYQDLLVAPGNLHDQFLKFIREETRHQKAGGTGRIVAKMNSLVDPDIIEALYQASGAGVKVDLVVRGICCLKPGIQGLSENIRVVSVIDRFLEHSRIYRFGEGDRERLYLSSADWMPRNFYHRYELAFPIKDPDLRRFVSDVILAYSLGDNVKGWELKPDGSYAKAERAAGVPELRSQERFEKLAGAQYEGTVLEKRIGPPPAAAPKPT